MGKDRGCLGEGKLLLPFPWGGWIPGDQETLMGREEKPSGCKGGIRPGGEAILPWSQYPWISARQGNGTAAGILAPRGSSLVWSQAIIKGAAFGPFGRERPWRLGIASLPLRANGASGSPG